MKNNYTFEQVIQKAKTILKSLGGKASQISMCYGVDCNKCPFTNENGECINRVSYIFSNYEKYENLVMNYMIPIDWSKVPVDTPILVRDIGEQTWSKRHFAKFEDGQVFVFCNGRTSYTSEDDLCTYVYAKLYEE